MQHDFLKLYSPKVYIMYPPFFLPWNVSKIAKLSLPTAQRLSSTIFHSSVSFVHPTSVTPPPTLSPLYDLLTISIIRFLKALRPRISKQTHKHAIWQSAKKKSTCDVFLKRDYCKWNFHHSHTRIFLIDYIIHTDILSPAQSSKV